MSTHILESRSDSGRTYLLTSVGKGGESGEMSALADVATAHPFYFAMVFWLLSLRRGCLYVSM